MSGFAFTSARSAARVAPTRIADHAATPAELLRSALALLASRIGAAARHRHDVRQLSALDDRLLGDIGITRGEIERAARCGRD